MNFKGPPANVGGLFFEMAQRGARVSRVEGSPRSRTLDYFFPF